MGHFMIPPVYSYCKGIFQNKMMVSDFFYKKKYRRFKNHENLFELTPEKIMIEKFS